MVEQNIQINTNEKVADVFNNYPKHIVHKIKHLRDLILQVAKETETITAIEETLKWGEPSYLVKKGSTVRIDWKTKTPNQYAIYFKCTSKLVETFKVVFKDVFQFEGHRAIVFQLDDTIPETELKQCIATALTYHKVKHLPLLDL
ncbi:DUF1801 domain-containing protein [Algibacter miyuki]|uniref:DUF1801 domain-containing protein n=1 Tax=Algibacter miyuki TaxID=1306933 RepID=A0ABV5GYV4_9FLAO|nr:DUF1801 domain-containing protein [Algibacter miyuki]MDN3666991.1 DUF1801 domain-containing protein [Algibacter miyuki]